MKYALLSDIHANLEALETVLARCRELAVDSYLSDRKSSCRERVSVVV